MSASHSKSEERPGPSLKEHLAVFADLPVEEAGSLLELVSDPSCWMLGEAPGTWVIRVLPGPSLRGAQVYLLRFRGEVDIASKPREAVQRLLILKGALVDESGRELRAGQSVQNVDGTGGIRATALAECVCCVVTHRT